MIIHELWLTFDIKEKIPKVKKYVNNLLSKTYYYYEILTIDITKEKGTVRFIIPSRGITEFPHVLIDNGLLINPMITVHGTATDGSGYLLYMEKKNQQGEQPSDFEDYSDCEDFTFWQKNRVTG